MNGANLTRLILTVLALIWAIASINPLSNTPYEDHLLERVTARYDDQGATVLSRDENFAEFEALLDRARARVAAAAASDESSTSTVYLALRQITAEEGIDLGQYFGDLRIRDIANLQRRNEIVLNSLLKSSKAALQPGLDLAGGVSITFEVPVESLSGSSLIRSEEMRDARAVMLRRIDSLGVAEPIVRLKGENQIEVQMPGFDGAANPNLVEEIGAPALLEFKIVNMEQRPFPGATPPLGFEVSILENEDSATGQVIEEPLYLRRIPVMKGDSIDEARAVMNEVGAWRVLISFTSEGAQKFAEVTEQIARSGTAQAPGRLAIVLDGQLISAPTVRERIGGGNAEISGSFSQREASNLANALNNPLAVPLIPAEIYQVEATFAKEAQSASFRAALYAGLFVGVFMIFWYGVAGIVSMVTVVANILLVLGTLSMLGATITLPGIAALVLTVGMAVDANILIFERIREELKAGKSIGHAVTDGYGKAFSTIIDANVTTLITATILIIFGTGPVKGFGVTLSAGIVATVFTSLVMSRWLIDGGVLLGVIKRLPARFNFLDRSAIPFMNFAPRAFAASWAIVAIGILAVILHWGTIFGIDFRGGDEVTVAYQQPISVQEVATVAEARDFGEVNTISQVPLGAEQEFLTIQTESGRGADFFLALKETYPEAGLEQIGLTQIGASVGDEVRSSAVKAIGLSLLAMLFYIAVRFEFGYGLGALVATVHDVLLTVGMFVALGEFFNIGSGQFTAPMIAAVLMVMGYSINDTIVVFDRIREELELNPGTSLKKIIHLSINRVLSRTVLTSLTTLFASFSLYLFGAGVIVDFALVFLLGILTGTFSSIFIASPIFFRYHKGDRKSVEKGEILPSYDWTSEANPNEKKA